jgi:beta-galactosidase
VLWSAGNEVHEQWGEAQTVRKMVDLFHREDPTRPVTVACHQIGGEPSGTLPEFLEALDVVGYNYVDRFRDRKEKYYSVDKQAHPNWKVIGTESAGMGRGLNLDVEQLWKFVRTYDYVSGDFMWTGIDYIGESGWPAKNSSSGVLDTCGFKKDGYYFYQSQWTSGPMLHLFPNWNRKGKEGQIVAVTCFTNCENVELFLNGKSYGVKGYVFPRRGLEPGVSTATAPVSSAVRTTSDLHLSWDVPYEPGTLKAVGTRGGKEVITTEVSTTGDPAAISLAIDRDSIVADRRDVAHLTVHIVDDQGRVVPGAENEVAFTIQGEGRIIGVDNGNPLSHEDYKANRRKAYNGACLAIIQSTARPGQVQLTASSAGLKSQSVTIVTTASR